MGESERYIDRRFKKITLGQDNNALIALISINGIGFAILGLIKLVYLIVESPAAAFANEILPWFVLPAKLSILGKSALDHSKLHVCSYRHYCHVY